MALNLNLLHEEILEQRQRQRDPLKIGVIVLVVLGSLLFTYYIWNAYRTLEIKSRLGGVEREWAKVGPQVTAAQKRAASHVRTCGCGRGASRRRPGRSARIAG